MTERFDHEGIKALAATLGRTGESLIALAKMNDPFFANMPGRREKAEWFARLWHQFNMPARGHIRGLHYRIISQESVITMADGTTPYENTLCCWKKLTEASKDARYLELIAPEDFTDQRNAEAVVNSSETAAAPSAAVYGAIELSELEDMPELPWAALPVIKRTQPYQLELWIEKSTMDNVLLPIASEYDVHFVAGAGEASMTRCLEVLERAGQNGRPVRILYISDFDPGGQSMPVAAARKMEFFIRSRAPDLDVQLIPIALTYEQCQHYRLPRTPIKDTEIRAGRFERRFGEGATELDALEALHPGELANIVEREILRFYDDRLDDRTVWAARRIRRELDEVTEDVHHRHRKAITALQREYAAIVKARTAWETRAAPLWHAITTEIEAEIEPIMDQVEWPEPKDADEYESPLFDSQRSYVKQIGRYKEFQGKAAAEEGGHDGGDDR
jgi:hypothetical protein